MTEKIYLNGVSHELNLNLMPKEQFIDKILYLAKYKGLPLYFDDEIIGSKVSDGVEEFEDENGRIMDLKANGDIIPFKGRKRLVPPEVSKGLYITISNFVYDDEEYYPVDLSSYSLRDTNLDYLSFYCIDSELKSFIENTKIGIEVPDEDRLSDPSNREVLLENSNSTNNLDLAWDDLLINPPKTDSEIFTHFKNAVINYIKREKQLPTRNQVWEELKSMFKFDTKKRAIIGLSSKPMDRDNFCANYKRYTTKPRQKQDK